MKKVLIASYSLGYGGIEKSLINLLKNFDYEKYKVTLVLERQEGVFLDEVPSEVNIKEYKVSDNKNIFIRKISNLLKRIKWIIFNFKRYSSSICYATYSKPCGFVARSSAKNSILFVHNNYYSVFKNDDNKTKEFFKDLQIHKYNKVVFVSNESRIDIRNLMPKIEKKLVTINNLVDSDEIISLSKKRISIKKNNKRVFTFVGRLDEGQKRLSLLLNVAKKCKDNNDNAMFWIVGSGPDERRYKSFVTKNKLDNVLFLGPQPNPYPYIKKSDYLILTSNYEGFPVVYNEAIILEKPIITTIDVTDDYISIPNRFGVIVNENNIYDEVRKLTKKKMKISETVDFNNLNTKRINAIKKILGDFDD